jgi:hypothetical protein
VTKHQTRWTIEECCTWSWEPDEHHRAHLCHQPRSRTRSLATHQTRTSAGTRHSRSPAVQPDSQALSRRRALTETRARRQCAPPPLLTRRPTIRPAEPATGRQSRGRRPTNPDDAARSGRCPVPHRGMAKDRSGNPFVHPGSGGRRLLHSRVRPHPRPRLAGGYRTSPAALGPDGKISPMRRRYARWRSSRSRISKAAAVTLPTLNNADSTSSAAAVYALT